MEFWVVAKAAKDIAFSHEPCLTAGMKAYGIRQIAAGRLPELSTLPCPTAKPAFVKGAWEAATIQPGPF
jgi:hypothetical protein